MIKVQKLIEDAKLPTRKHSTDAGLDLYADIYNYNMHSPLRLEARQFAILHTSIKVEIPKGYFGWITNKSKRDYIIGGGIVDFSYRGELLVKVINPYTQAIQIHHGEAIAQLLIIPCITPEVLEVENLDINTDRGETGGIVGQLVNLSKKELELE